MSNSSIAPPPHLIGNDEWGIGNRHTYLITHNFQLKILALYSTISLSILYTSIVLCINRKYTSNFALIISAAPITHYLGGLQ